MSLKREIVFEVCAFKSKKVIIYGERKLGQIEVRAIDSERGDVEVGYIPDVWRKNDNMDAQLRAARKLLKLSENDDITLYIADMLSKLKKAFKTIEEITNIT